MAHGLDRLKTFLDGEGVSYHVIHHPADVRARETAADTDTPPEEFAKTVILWVDGDPAMAVVPASRDVALGKLRRALGAAEVRLAHEREIGVLCPDCRMPGSAHPQPGTIALLGALLAGDWVVVDAAGDRERREAHGLVAAYLAWHLERGLRSMPYATGQ